jgi:hypothetical protein
MAKNNILQTSSASQQIFNKNLNEDSHRLQRRGDEWSHARNAVTNTVVGDIGDLSNESSNYLAASAPYTIIGVIHVAADEWCVFSTNNVNSEIGIFKEDSMLYQGVVNSTLLNFKQTNLIKGVGRIAADCGRLVYWDDGLNPTRFINLDDVPYIQDFDPNADCKIYSSSGILDVERLRLSPLIESLQFTVARGDSAGQLINGSYYVVGAYLVNGQKVTNYSTPSNIQPLFEHSNMACSLDIFVDNADTTFSEFELVLVQFANFNTVAKRIGVYSTSQKKITLDSLFEGLEDVDIKEIPVNNSVAEKSNGVFRNGAYLLRTSPIEDFDFNYQPLANQIEASWVSVEYPASYYRDGGSNQSFLRDEVYSLFIRWVYAKGYKSKSYHIPGRYASDMDMKPVSGDNVLAGDTKYWQVHNTATPNPASNLIGTVLKDGGVVRAVGKMGYWESTEKYPDDKPEIWNASSNSIWGGGAKQSYELCGKPIRHHKFPDNETTNHFNTFGTGAINILTVQLSNVQPPLDNDGNPIAGIVGYEILRGSREGNKTILAKGLLNNMREYKTDIPNKRFLYPNYPYNHQGADKFLSETPTDASNSLNNYDAYLDNDAQLTIPGIGGGSNLATDMMTFHSPDTNFRNPFLSAKELKVYGTSYGTMYGQFQIPKDHPKQKFITGTSFVLSAIIGMGYAIMATEGEKKKTTYDPKIDYGGTATFVGPAGVGSTGVFGASAIAAAAQAAAVNSAVTANAILYGTLSSSFVSAGLSAIGIDSSITLDSAIAINSALAGSTGGAGGYVSREHISTPWSSTPDLLRIIQGIPTFLSFWGEGINKMLTMIYSFIPYRQFALQQISHGFYDKFDSIQSTYRRTILDSTYLNPSLQDFGDNYRINNIYRSRTVLLQTEHGINLPERQDNSQALYSTVYGRTDKNKWENPNYVNNQFERDIASYYAALKQRIDNQYGQLQGILQIPVSREFSIDETFTEPIFGGDVYITRYTEKNTMFFFYDWLQGQPDGATFNYALRKMIPNPRFWMDTDPYDVGEFVNSLGSLFKKSDDETSMPGSFNPFAINPNVLPQEIVTEDVDGNVIKKPNPNYKADPKCGCSDTTDCYFDKNQIAKICTSKQLLDEAKILYDYMIVYACSINVNDFSTSCTACNPNNKDISELFDMSLLANCTSCLATVETWTEADAQLYFCDETAEGIIRVAVTNQKAKVAQYQKDYDANIATLYDGYMQTLTDSDDGSFVDKFKNLKVPNDKYAFDIFKAAGIFRLSVKNAWMYLFNSGVRDFYVESEVNCDLRDWEDEPSKRHYDNNTYTDLRELFDVDHIKVGNFMKYDYSLSASKLFNNFISWSSLQDRTYNPLIAENCYVNRHNRILYSLPQQLENQSDNWRIFLPLNYKDFNSVTTSIKPINKNGALLFFENESPVQFLGVDQLETDAGTKITIGDGGLFSQPLQNLVNTEYSNEYGSCQNRLAIASTPYGIFYMSQNQGKIFKVAGNGLEDISAYGMKWWFATYLPYQLTQHPTAFKNADGTNKLFELADNPVIGIGCQVIYDNRNQEVFFCKKDWKIRTDIPDKIVYKQDNIFIVNDIFEVLLGDPSYFEAASWTASFDPKSNQGQGGWISYHDWHPDLVLPTKNTFMTTKGSALWVHSDRWDNFCNFYGQDYPFEIEYTTNSKFDINVLRNVNYIMEIYKYADNMYDRFHVLDENFDEAVVYNTEQCSGLLKLNLTPKNNTQALIQYPKVNSDSIDILYSKEEQKYRFNQFWDITKDRGEFNGNAERVIMNTAANGYIRTLNAANLDYNKSAFEHKKFRHYNHTVLLRKLHCGNRNYVMTMLVQNNLTSSR